MNQYHWQETYGSTLPPQGTDVFVCVNGKVDVAWLDDGANGVQLPHHRSKHHIKI